MTVEPEVGREAYYVLGRSAKEVERLQSQAAFVQPFTERLFRDAGIARGMKVLDLGSGAGDVALLTARLVGPEGTVVGIDTDPASLKSHAPEPATLNIAMSLSKRETSESYRLHEILTLWLVATS